MRPYARERRLYAPTQGVRTSLGKQLESSISVFRSGRCGLCPVAAVQRAVLDGLGNVPDGDVGLAAEVGDGAGDLEDAVVGAGAEALLLHGALQQALCVGG